MKFMVTSRKGAAAAVAFLLASPVVALTGVGAGVAQAGVLYGPTQSTLPGSLFLQDDSTKTNATTNNTFTDTFSISLNPASPGVGQVTTVSFSGTKGPATGPVGVKKDTAVVRVTMELSGTNTGTIDLASGSACNYPLADTPSNLSAPNNFEGAYTATGTFTPTTVGSTSIALKQILFDDQGDGFNFGANLCNGTGFNANYYASTVTQTAGSGLAGLAKTAPVASPTIKVDVTVNDTPGPTDSPTTPPATTPPATTPPATTPPATTPPATTPPATTPPATTPPATTPTGPTQDIPSTVSKQVAGVKCQNGIAGVSNWTDGDTGGYAADAGLTPAPPISDPTFTVALTPAAPTAGQKVTIAVSFDKGITNGPSPQTEGKTRPSARVIVTGALTTTIIINGTPYGTVANPVRQGQRFPGQTMTKANAFTFPAEASATNPVFVELQTIAFDTKSGTPNFNWPNGPADTFLTVCNKSAAPLTATSSGPGRVTAQAAIVPIDVTAAVPFVGEVTPPPTIPPVDDNGGGGGGGSGTDTSGGTLPKTGGNPISSLWVALILFQIGLIMAVRSVRAAPVKTARHL